MSGMNRTPTVSVCIPVYNAEQFIARAIESALAQGYPALEIIVQDNASTDSTWAIVSALAAKHPEIKARRNPSNIGMAPNWNAALAGAKGDFLLLLNADDALEPGYFDACLEVFSRENPDLVTINHFFVCGAEKTVRSLPIKQGMYRNFARELLRLNPFPVVFALFRRATVERFSKDGKLFREEARHTCDYELMMRLAAGGASLYYLDRPLASYSRHGGNLSRRRAEMNAMAADAILLHGKELRRQARGQYLVTLLGYVARVLVNLPRCGVWDGKLFVRLIRELCASCVPG